MALGRRDLTGQKFGKLRITGTPETVANPTMWTCQCDCGHIIVRSYHQLDRGKTNSCGCYKKEWAARVKTVHGLRSCPEYSIWNGMKQRCGNPNQGHYERYGGRGIYVCEEWRNSFEQFYKDMGPRPTGPTGKKYTIDRIDNDGPYEPGNCRWVTVSEQNLNQRPRKRASS